MEQPFKTFDHLTWYNNKGRDDAYIDFENGWGLYIWLLRYSGDNTYQFRLRFKGEDFKGPMQAQFRKFVFINSDQITELIQAFQRL